MTPTDALPRYVGGSGGLVRSRMFAAKHKTVVPSSLLISVVGERGGFRARVMCVHRKASRASFVEWAPAASLRLARDVGEK